MSNTILPIAIIGAGLAGRPALLAGTVTAMGDDALTAACLAQLERLFGPEAARPRATRDATRQRLRA